MGDTKPFCVGAWGRERELWFVFSYNWPPYLNQAWTENTREGLGEMVPWLGMQRTHILCAERLIWQLTVAVTPAPKDPLPWGVHAVHSCAHKHSNKK